MAAESILNRKALRDFHILDRYEAGIERTMHRSLQDLKYLQSARAKNAPQARLQNELTEELTVIDRAA